MTSTVLDVAVFLLCLSAGVGVITNAGAVDRNAAAPPDAADVADVVSGSTETVEYRDVPDEGTDSDTDASGENATATHHATLAELIARAAVLEADGESDEVADYPSAVRRAVRETLRDLRGGRVRLTASHAVGEAEPTPLVVGAEPPPNSDVDVAVVTAPGTLENRRTQESGRRVRILVEVW